MINGWFTFWIMLGIITATETIVDYLTWKTKIEYGVKDKKSLFRRIFFKESR